jgi:hypothetical protein
MAEKRKCIELKIGAAKEHPYLTVINLKKQKNFSIKSITN